MKTKCPFLALFILLFLTSAEAQAKKLRFGATGGYAFANEIVDETGFMGGGLFHIAYPVSSKSRIINTEVSIVNWYNAFPLEDDYMGLFRLGFGIRIFLNASKSIRPYFTHDITSHIIQIKSRDNYAATYGILLGLGIDIPIGENKDEECSSIFVDVSYNSFKEHNFNTEDEAVRFISLSAGYSFNLKKKKRVLTK